jgi:DNA polymerase-1
MSGLRWKKMRFITDAPPPVFVGSRDMIEPVIRQCREGYDRLLGVDTETLGKLKNPDHEFLDSKGKLKKMPYTNMTDQVIVMGLAPDDDHRFLVPAKYLHLFKELLEDESVPKALTYVKFDVHRISNTSGIVLGGRWADTVHLDFMLDEDTRENRHGLKPCAADYLGLPLRDYNELFGSVDPRTIVLGHELWEKYVDYSCLDPWATRKVALYQLDELAKIPVWDPRFNPVLHEEMPDYTLADMYWETEEPQLKCLWRMERRGVKVDKKRLEEIHENLVTEMDEIARELNRIAGYPFNPGSTPQVAEYLFEKKKLPIIKTTPGGKPSTDAEVLEALAHGSHQVEEAKLLLKYRSCSRDDGTSARGMLRWIYRDGRVHTSYSSTKVTGRLGSSEPNLQNVPSRKDKHGFRAAFIAEEGCKLMVVDYSQLEMRIFAFAAGEEGMMQAIADGLDLHCFAGALMMDMEYDEFFRLAKIEEVKEYVDMRTAAKKVGFGIIYNQGKYGLSATLSQELGNYVSPDEAQAYIDKYTDALPGIRTYKAAMLQAARKLGFVQTLCGRYRRLSKIKDRSRFYKSRAENQAINTPIQGSAADIVKRAMILIDQDEYLNEELGWHLLLQVHDELVLEGPEESADEALELVKYYMEHPFSEDLPVPLVADPKIVDNWKEGK